jgi:hypothetical protein
MAEYLTKTIDDSRDLWPGRALEVRFRPGPGPITVTSRGVAVVVERPSGGPGSPWGQNPTIVDESLSDTGIGERIEELVELPLRIDLLHPGTPAPAQTVTGTPHQGAMQLRYNATSQDLSSVGEWVCRVTNVSESDLKGTFNTKVSYTSPVEIRTATFDLGLLNQLFFQVVEALGLEVRLYTSASAAQKRSRVSWSESVTKLLLDKDNENETLKEKILKKLAEEAPQVLEKIEFNNATTALNVRLPSIHTEKEVEIDIPLIPNPSFDIPLTVDIRDLNSRELHITLREQDGTSHNAVIDAAVQFETAGPTEILAKTPASISIPRVGEIGVGARVDLTSLTMKMSFRLIDGTPSAAVNVTATASASLIGVTDVEWEVGKAIGDALQGRIREYLDPPAVRSTVRDGVAAFLKALMRLGSDARLQSVKVDGRKLVVRYYREPVLMTVRPPDFQGIVRPTLDFEGIVRPTA